ncbi:uncharacterized protein LOC141533535 [Cotesia typhae]|uniref:uncharacterized protein LOC141533535 n=1 Tax=Cotesia typhae TaxID=2053667 RepID=UPI003D68D436
MLGKWCLFLSSQGAPVIAETKLLFKYDNKKKVSITEKDKDNDNLSIRCPAMNDDSIQLIDTHDDKQLLKNKNQPKLKKRIRTLKRLSMTPKITMKSLKFNVNADKKIIAAQRKRNSIHKKAVIKKADEYYKDINNRQGRGSEEIADDTEMLDSSSDTGSNPERQPSPQETSPLITRRTPPSSPERTRSASPEGTSSLTVEQTSPTSPSRRPPSVVDESEHNSPERTPTPVVRTPPPLISARIADRRSSTGRHLSPRGNDTKKMKANIIIHKFTEISECMANITDRLTAVESKIADHNISNDHPNNINSNHENNNSTNLNNVNSHDDEFILNPDENREVEIIPGFKMNYTDCANTCNAPRMSTRARRVILSVWPVERRQQLTLRPDKKRPDWEVVQESDIIQIINLCVAMQKVKHLDDTKGNNAALNMRVWIGNTLKNDRALKKKIQEEDNSQNDPSN